jgi:2-polyprenyl-6-methoxyphenol hydroxylase-like FAD-dependent oxidoreductase
MLVAGAGPVGLATALFAAGLGRKVMVADAKPRGVTHSYALALHPAALALLDSVGVAGDILARALPVRSLAVYSGNRRIASIPVAPAGAKFPFLAVVGQDVLENVLGRILTRRGVRIAWSHRLARFTPGTDSVAVELDEMEERVIGYAAARFDWMVKSTHAVEAGHLIGADGHDSLVRRQLGVEFPEVRPAEHFAVFEFQRTEGIDDEIALVLHPEGLGVLWPLPGGRGRWSFAIPPEASPEAWREKDHEPVQILGPGVFPSVDEEMLRRLLSTRAPWFSARFNFVYWRMLVRFERRLAATFGQGRVWLAGDAGHLTGPAGIQSMNVGLREAHDVARGIAGADANGSIAEALRAYDNARQLEWRGLLGLTGRVDATSAAAPEIAENAERLLACLPASGEALGVLADRLGLRLVE